MKYPQNDEMLVPDHVTLEQLREVLSDFMDIELYRELSLDARPVVEFVGRMSGDDLDATFEALIVRLRPLGYTPLLSPHEDMHLVQLLPQIADSRTGKVWVNALLFGLTLLSVLFVGAMHENVDPLATPGELWRGWPFALAILAILTTHELSHYFVGRRYGSPLSLPYFIPLPISILGTMGAVILQKGPMHSRKALFDIGAAGPIGGLIVAIPLLFLGLANSEVGAPSRFLPPEVLQQNGLSQEGNSLLYIGAKYLVYGRILPDAQGEDVWLSPPSRGGSLAFAAWAGLLVSALNLFPIGQLDGGHVAYALWGRKAWRVADVFMLLTLVWGGVLLLLFNNPAGWTWLVWAGLGRMMNPHHPAPLNDVTPLDPRRRFIGWVLVVVFLLVLVPIPLMIVTVK